MNQSMVLFTVLPLKFHVARKDAQEQHKSNTRAQLSTEYIRISFPVPDSNSLVWIQVEMVISVLKLSCTVAWIFGHEPLHYFLG